MFLRTKKLTKKSKLSLKVKVTRNRSRSKENWANGDRAPAKAGFN